MIEASERALQGSPWARLDDQAVEAFAAAAPERWLRLPDWDDAGMLVADDAKVVAWLLAYNAINFCYWPDAGPRWFPVVDGAPMGEDDEALGVMGAFAAAIRSGVPLDDGAWLSELDAATLDDLLRPARGAGHLPMMPERLAGLRELGRALVGWGGADGLLHACGRSAPRLVEMLVVGCPLWSDDRLAPDGSVIQFRKRAQLCVAMIAARVGGFADLDALTAFADYRLPQILRGTGILVVHPGLAERIERREHLPAGTAEEVALRAAVVAGADRIVRALNRRGAAVDALIVDHLLWRTAVERQDTLPPFHRTRTTAY